MRKYLLFVALAIYCLDIVCTATIPADKYAALPYGDPSRLPAEQQEMRSDILSFISEHKWDPVDLPQAGYNYVANGGSDVVVNNISNLAEAMYAAASNYPDKYNRIRLQAGYWEGDFGIGSGQRRGPLFVEGGGLIIEPDVGHNPIFKGTFQFAGDRIVLRRLTLAYAAPTDGSNLVLFETSGLTGFYSPEGPWPGRYIIEDCNFGGIFNGQNAEDYQTWVWMARISYAYSLVARRNTFRGMNRGFVLARAMVGEFYGNDYGEATNNPFLVSQLGATGQNGWDKLPTNDSYYYIHQELTRGCMDIDPALGTHMDFFQITSFGPKEEWGSIHYWIEDNLVTGAHKYYTFNEANTLVFPTVNMLIYTWHEQDPQESVRGGLFNNLCATNGFFVQAGHPNTNTQVWFNTAGVQATIPAVEGAFNPSASTQYFFGTGQYHSGYNIMRAPIGTLPSTGDAVMSSAPSTVEAERPETYFLGNFPRRALTSSDPDPAGLSYWSLLEADTIYEIDANVLRVALIDQFKRKDGVQGGAAFTVPDLSTPTATSAPQGTNGPSAANSPSADTFNPDGSVTSDAALRLPLWILTAFVAFVY